MGTTMPVRRQQEDDGEITGYESERPGGRGAGAAIEIAQTRAAQEVQASIVMAKKFPRDQVAAFDAIMQTCKRKRLAEQSQYAYPKGGTTVTGPSIHLAKALAQNWGNLDFGIIEVEQRKGESTMMAYCWDQQTNVKETRVFTVPHERHTRNGSYALTDPRDIYELTANQGARRLRGCILGIIPGDVVDAALDECDKTLAGDSKSPLVDRARIMVQYFDSIGVTLAQVETRLGHRLDALTEAELVSLRKIATSIKDNMASIASFFPSTTTDEKPAAKGGVNALADKLKKPAAKKSEPVEPQQEQPPTQEESNGPSRQDQLCIMLSELETERQGKDISVGAATDKLNRWAQTAFKKPFASLDSKTLDNCEARIRAGEIEV